MVGVNGFVVKWTYSKIQPDVSNKKEIQNNV
jgi:hypothetical protein